MKRKPVLILQGWAWEETGPSLAGPTWPAPSSFSLGQSHCSVSSPPSAAFPPTHSIPSYLLCLSSHPADTSQLFVAQKSLPWPLITHLLAPCADIYQPSATAELRIWWLPRAWQKATSLTRLRGACPDCPVHRSSAPDTSACTHQMTLFLVNLKNTSAYPSRQLKHHLLTTLRIPYLTQTTGVCLGNSTPLSQAYRCHDGLAGSSTIYLPCSPHRAHISCVLFALYSSSW